MPNMLPHAGHTHGEHHETHGHPEHVGGSGGAGEGGEASPFLFWGNPSGKDDHVSSSILGEGIVFAL